MIVDDIGETLPSPYQLVFLGDGYWWMILLMVQKSG